MGFPRGRSCGVCLNAVCVGRLGAACVSAVYLRYTRGGTDAGACDGRSSIVMAQISIELLGPVRATVGGVDLALGGSKQRAVVAMLALRVNELVSADRLMEGLW